MSPLNSSFANSSARGTGHKLNGLYWLNSISIDNSVFLNGFKSATEVASTGDVFSVSSTLLSDWTNWSVVFRKYNQRGSKSWVLSNLFTSGNMESVASDSSGNLYATFSSLDGSPDGYGGYYVANHLVKFNSSGTILWQKKIYSASTQGGGVYVAPSGNVYVQTAVNISYNVISKFDSNGNLQWNRSFYKDSNTAYSAMFAGVGFDSSENIYVTCIGSNAPYVIKYDSNGTAQWQRIINIGSSGVSIGGISVDSNGNSYISFHGKIGANPNMQFIFVKLNSSGTYQWHKSLPNSIGSDGGYACGTVVAKNGNVSVGFWDPSYGILLSQYDTNGNLLTTNYIGYYSINGIVNNNTNSSLFIAANYNYYSGNPQNGYAYLAKLPIDSSKSTNSNWYIAPGNYGFWYYGNYNYYNRLVSNTSVSVSAGSATLGSYAPTIVAGSTSFSDITSTAFHMTTGV